MESYELEPGPLNPVYDAAQEFLGAAEMVYAKQQEKTGFLAVRTWHVVHHLSFIAVELFLKSLNATAFHEPAEDESGALIEYVQHSYRGHEIPHDVLEKGIYKAILNYLPLEQQEMVLMLRCKKSATEELTRGRYPYEVVESFPAGDGGRILAERWLHLARALGDFKFGRANLLA